MDFMLLKIQDTVKIDGECTLTGFEKCIEITSFQHGVSLPIQDTTSNTGRTTGRPNVPDMYITKSVDASSTGLIAACIGAKDVGKTQVYLVRQDGTSGTDTYMSFEMTDTMISSVSASGQVDGIGIEQVSLNFDQITWTYSGQKKETGQKGQLPAIYSKSTNTVTAPKPA